MMGQPGSGSAGLCPTLGSCLCSVTQQTHFLPLVFGEEHGEGTGVWAAELLCTCGGPRQLESGGESPGMFLEPTPSRRRGLRCDSLSLGLSHRWPFLYHLRFDMRSLDQALILLHLFPPFLSPSLLSLFSIP